MSGKQTVATIGLAVVLGAVAGGLAGSMTSGAPAGDDGALRKEVARLESALAESTRSAATGERRTRSSLALVQLWTDEVDEALEQLRDLAKRHPKNTQVRQLFAQALLAAGAPPEAFSFYPTTYAGAHELLLRSGRSLLFGDRSTVEPWRADPGVQIHGPGWSKVVIGADGAERWESSLDLAVESVAANGGRSCINASGVWTAARGRETQDEDD